MGDWVGGWVGGRVKPVVQPTDVFLNPSLHACRSCDPCWRLFGGNYDGVGCNACSAASGCTACDKGWVKVTENGLGYCKRPGAISSACKVLARSDQVSYGELHFKCKPTTVEVPLGSFLDPGCDHHRLQLCFGVQTS